VDIFQEVLEVVEQAECSHEVELLQEEVDRKVEQARLLSDLANRLIEEAREDEVRIACLMKTLPCVLSMVDYDAPGMKKERAA
jgi:hypothetical protein